MGSRGSELCKLVKLLQPGCGGQSGCNNPSSYSSALLMKGLGETLEISGEERGAAWATGLHWLVNLVGSLAAFFTLCYLSAQLLF